MHDKSVMQTRLPVLLAFASMITASACETKSGMGTAVGATGGGIVGAALGGGPGLVAGAALGGLMGYTAGRAMEEEDRRQMAYALEADRQARWTNSQTGNQYEVQPGRTMVENGRTCREFRMNAHVGGDKEQVHGTACQRSDGSWELVSG
jgi:surface antigen